LICVDANLLLYAHHTGFPRHSDARAWLDDRLNGADRVGLPWPSLLAFVRISVSPRVLERPLSVEDAWRQVEMWLEWDRVWVPLPTSRHRAVLGGLIQAAQSRPQLVMDAHLAALAVEHGLVLCSTDGDFARFPGLRWMNPLV